MTAELILSPETEQDLAEAYDWYEAFRVGLGEEFLSSVDACLQGVIRQPALHPFVLENYRRALVRRFPYQVFYEFADETVTIYGVFHTSRDPSRWRSRLKSE